MGGRIDTILMCVRFGDDRISSLDFSFIGGGVPLNSFYFNEFPLAEKSRRNEVENGF